MIPAIFLRFCHCRPRRVHLFVSNVRSFPRPPSPSPPPPASVAIAKPYADIRFVVLHRPYLETVASHMDQDGTVEQHSNVLRGFMLLLRRFLDDHPRDPLAPPGDRRKTWTLVCVERLKSSFYGDVGGAAAAWDEGRRQIASHLAEFLGWDNNRGTEDECPDCFDGWVESGRNKVAELGEDNVHVLLDHMRKLGGIWPPEVEDPLPEQKCIL